MQDEWDERGRREKGSEGMRRGEYCGANKIPHSNPWVRVGRSEDRKRRPGFIGQFKHPRTF